MSIRLPPRSRYPARTASEVATFAPQPWSYREVAAVGFFVGYSSPSQFGREYRRMFGAAPSQTAVRAAVIPCDTTAG